MTFATRLAVADGCSARRLTALVRALQRHDGIVRLAPCPAPLAVERFGAGRRFRVVGVGLEVDLPSGAYSWIVTGGFHALMARYPDVIRDFEPLDERRRHDRSVPPLPSA